MQPVMSSPLSTARSSHRLLGKSVPVWLALVIALIYAGGHLTWYLGTPLGRVPVLDEQENLTLAAAIFNGDLPAEPFYRSPGYALGLAGLRSLGVSASALFPAALALGVLLHALNAALVARIAGRLFGRRAAFFAGCLTALNPVLVHFATQALDAVPSLTLFLLGLDRLIKKPGARPTASDWFGASFYWAAATLVRPNFLLLWLLLTPLAAVSSIRSDQFRNAAVALSGAILLIALACWQWRVSGTPGFLPWQGAYNLWAANQPGAHGRYYVQTTALPASLARQNPARVESILHYQQATGRTDADIPAMNAYWRGRFVEEAITHPLTWLRLLARKAYALCNDWEQYNNKTYAFHHGRSPWLRWNPLSWGTLFVLGFAGLTRLAVVDRPRALTLLAIGAVYSASVLPFYVSDRFRLPLVVIGAVLSAGALAAPRFWRDWPRRRKRLLAAGVMLSAGLTFSRFDGVRSRATYVQDHALLARAADSIGDDRTAWNEARAALALQPEHPDAMRIAIAAHFNELLTGTAEPADEAPWLEISRRFLAVATAEADPSELRAIAALALWRAGEREGAVAEWRRTAGANATARAALALSGNDQVPPGAFASLGSDAWRQPLVQLAAALRGIAPPPGTPQTPVAFAHPAEIAARLFPKNRPQP